MQALSSYAAGRWHTGTGKPAVLVNATTEEPLAEVSSEGLDFAALLTHARERGGPALRELTFGQRGALLKQMSTVLHEHREELIELSIRNAGTTRGDAKFDLDGATGTLAAYASFSKSIGDRHFLVDGDGVQLGRTARFWGQHVRVPRHGVAVHVNAFNFPAWNMMEKAACALLAGAPVIEKPGTPTALVAWRIAQIVVESGLLPEGAFQFVCGSAGDLLDHLGPQDSLAFTGSSHTARILRSNENLIARNVRANIEADSLNAAVLAPDVESSSETFGLLLSTLVTEMTQKTGQKCTAIRRIFVPRERVEEVRDELAPLLGKLEVGDPSERTTRMGPLASAAQLRDVRAGIDRLAGSAQVACGGSEPLRDMGFFVAPTLLVADDGSADVFHAEEVFGPVATILPYSGDAAEASELVARGGGCLVSSLFTNDKTWAENAIAGMAPWNGRLWIASDKMAEQALSPGMVLPQMVHGGPGRAGGGEELGGLRGLEFYLQRTALQGFKGLVDGSFGAGSDS